MPPNSEQVESEQRIWYAWLANQWSGPYSVPDLIRLGERRIVERSTPIHSPSGNRLGSPISLGAILLYHPQGVQLLNAWSREEATKIHDWYVRRSGTTHGPFKHTTSETFNRVQKGYYLVSDYLWREGYESWAPGTNFVNNLPPISKGTDKPEARATNKDVATYANEPDSSIKDDSSYSEGGYGTSKLSVKSVSLCLITIPLAFVCYFASVLATMLVMGIMEIATIGPALYHGSTELGIGTPIFETFKTGVGFFAATYAPLRILRSANRHIHVSFMYLMSLLVIVVITMWIMEFDSKNLFAYITALGCAIVAPYAVNAGRKVVSGQEEL